jgi:hypothetical protein
MKQLRKIGGKLHKVYTIGELAKELKYLDPKTGEHLPRTTIGIRKLEDRKVLQPANFRLPNRTTSTGEVRLGDRIYTDFLVQKLKPIFLTEIKQGAKVSEKTIDKIRAAFEEELNLLQTK